MCPHVIAGLAIFLAAAASPAFAQSTDIKFVGQSRATVPLKRDIVTAIAAYSKARHSCGAVSAVEAAPLPQGYEPKTAMFRVSAPEHFYERWVVSLCGSQRAFFVAMWPSPKGGADYKILEASPGSEP
jgi:hypothetical protein